MATPGRSARARSCDNAATAFTVIAPTGTAFAIDHVGEVTFPNRPPKVDAIEIV